MNIAEWSEATKAKDIMVRDVVTLTPRATLAQAADLMVRKQISGAPVVNDKGVCLGICTAYDVLRAEQSTTRELDRLANSEFWTSGLALPASVYAEKLADVREKLGPLGEQFVQKIMTTDLVTVSELDMLDTIIVKMIDAHIHRVIVVDNDGRLVGIVSMTDILASLMRNRTSVGCMG